MNPTWSNWVRALASEAIEGAADAFLIVSGGSALSQTAPVSMPAITLQQLGWSVLLGAAWYAAAWLKRNPLPSCGPTGPQRAEAQSADPSAGAAQPPTAPTSP